MNKKIAIPLTQGVLSLHFGHCEVFYFANIENGVIKNEEIVTPPTHEPGLYPRWIKEQGADLVITGGIGQKARNLFAENKVELFIGSQKLLPKDIVQEYIAGTLTEGSNSCDH